MKTAIQLVKLVATSLLLIFSLSGCGGSSSGSGSSDSEDQNKSGDVLPSAVMDQSKFDQSSFSE